MADRIKALEELVRHMLGILNHVSVEAGVCCCGDDMESHSEPMQCGHVAVDMGAHAVLLWRTQAIAALEPGQ